MLSYGVIAYMMLAFAWWTILLYIKNDDAFQAKKELIKIGMIAQGLVQTEEDFLQTETYLALEKHYHRQEWMIIGEATVFVFSLIIGVWLINRGYHKEMIAALQRRNFLLSITHELKSPIASIRLVLETFMRRRLSSEQSEKLTQNALKETERLHTLVNDLLLSAKLETAYQLNPVAIDLEQLFVDLIAEFETKYPNVHFSLQHDDPIPQITGDKPGLSSVAINLLENAVKYSGADPRVSVSLAQENGRIKIDVADNGIGIDDKEKKRIFDKFYRVGNEDTRKTKGTGLGLYIVDQIVKAHKGSIVVRDNHPRGTVFHIEIPLGSLPDNKSLNN